MSEQVLTQPRTQSHDTPSLFQHFVWNITDALVITRRNLMYYIRLPQLLVFSTIQPVMFLLLFAYVFGGAIATPNGSYINYLLPGIIVQTVLFGGTATTIGLAEDLSKGLIDRFRSLPMARSAVLAGRTIADSVRNTFVVVLMIVVGYIIGFRFQNSLIPTLGALAIVILFGHVMSWVSANIGLLVKDPETAQVAGFIWIFPMVFASSIFVPPSTMPRALQVFAENQPVSVIATVVRDLMLDIPTDDVWKALAWLAAIWLVFMPLAVTQYRRNTV